MKKRTQLLLAIAVKFLIISIVGVSWVSQAGRTFKENTVNEFAKMEMQLAQSLAVVVEEKVKAGETVKLTDLFKEIKFAKGGYVTAFDDQGTLVYHPRPEFSGKNVFSEEMQQATGRNEVINNMVRAALRGEAGLQRYVFGGDEKIAAYVPAHLPAGRLWGVVVTIPIKDILAAGGATRMLTEINIFMPLLILIVMGVYYLYLLFTLIQPIEGLCGVLKNISQGKLDTVINPKLLASKDELGDLARTFDRVLASLKLAMREKGQ